MQLEIATLRDILAQQNNSCPKCSSENFISSTVSNATTASEKLSIHSKAHPASFQTDEKDFENIIKERLKRFV